MPYSYPKYTPNFARSKKLDLKKKDQKNVACKSIVKKKLNKKERAVNNLLLIERRLRLHSNCVFGDFAQDGKHTCCCEHRTAYRLINENCKPENTNRCNKPEKCSYRKNKDVDTVLYSTTND